MAKSIEGKIPLILRFHRLMDVFTKSNDERDFYLDSLEGFLIYADLDKGSSEIEPLEKELKKSKNRFRLIPKMTFFEIKKFMEGFINEKVYDIDTKEKLLDIINSKDPRENFLEFIYEQLTELEKWQQYYQEKSRIKVIEWLRSQNLKFVFEEDVDFSANVMERLKRTFFDDRVSKEIASARKFLENKAQTYYSTEALNPRPKRGRPPKQIAKAAIEPQFTVDIYKTVPKPMVPFLHIPNILSAAAITFSSQSDEKLLAWLKGTRTKVDTKLEALSQRLESLKKLSEKFSGGNVTKLEETLRTFKAAKKPKIEKEAVKIIPTKKGLKVGSVIEGVLPKKRGRPKKVVKEGEYIGPEKKAVGIKKVSQIKSRKRKKK